MSENAMKFGSREWLKAWGERLLQGIVNTTAEAISTVGQRPASPSTATQPGSVMRSALTWIPYVLIGAAALILVLAIRKKG